MNTMNMPGFAAENSIYKTKGRYCMAAAFDAQNASANVQPALPSKMSLCDFLAELVWNAHNEGALNRAEFWEHVMDRAGCFA